MKTELRSAFEAVSNGLSPDRVVCDPDLNSEFLAECQRLGLLEEARDLNRTLLNLRKRGEFSSRAPSRRSNLGDDSEYRFASEMAARYLERRDGISLDNVICDPAMAAEFDQLAAQIAPGFTPLQYRWSALRLRKTRRLRPEIIAQAISSFQVSIERVAKVDVNTVSTAAGLYMFFVPSQTLYVGEASNLRLRMKKHFDHSDNKGLARWMWDYGTEDIFLELHILEDQVSTRTRRALEAELIMSRRPVFNVQGR